MKLRKTLRTPVSIGDEIGYQEALNEVTDAAATFSSLPRATVEDENTPAYRLAEAAANSAWEALTALIDCYVARRISETLEKL